MVLPGTGCFVKDSVKNNFRILLPFPQGEGGERGVKHRKVIFDHSRKLSRIPGF